MGSTWLTAFVVKSFAQATPYIYIDKNQQSRSIQFFRKNQMTSGCFKKVFLCPTLCCILSRAEIS